MQQQYGILEIEPLQDRDYTKDEIVRMENKILLDIMGNSSKNGDIDKAREEYKSTIDKCERYKI